MGVGAAVPPGRMKVRPRPGKHGSQSFRSRSHLLLLGNSEKRSNPPLLRLAPNYERSGLPGANPGAMGVLRCFTAPSEALCCTGGASERKQGWRPAAEAPSQPAGALGAGSSSAGATSEFREALGACQSGERASCSGAASDGGNPPALLPCPIPPPIACRQCSLLLFLRPRCRQGGDFLAGAGGNDRPVRRWRLRLPASCLPQPVPSTAGGGTGSRACAMALHLRPAQTHPPHTEHPKIANSMQVGSEPAPPCTAAAPPIRTPAGPAPCLPPCSRVPPLNKEEMSRTVRAVILAGGETKSPLTKYRAMPAVPLGSSLLMVDVPLNNCLVSGVNKMWVPLPLGLGKAYLA